MQATPRAQPITDQVNVNFPERDRKSLALFIQFGISELHAIKAMRPVHLELQKGPLQNRDVFQT